MVAKMILFATIPDTPWTLRKIFFVSAVTSACGQLSAHTYSGVPRLAGRRECMGFDATTVQCGSLTVSCRYINNTE